MSDTPRVVPGLSPQRRHPPAPYVAPTNGTVEERLADIARAINGKADRVGIPNVTALQMTSESGLPFLIYVDSAGTLRCVPVTP